MEVTNFVVVRNLIKLSTAILVLFLYSTTALAAPHPLRPFPKNPPGTPDSSFLTPYCAERPTAVQVNRFDKRTPTITLTVQGELTSDFTEFVTPLLSVTDPAKEDSTAEFETQGKRYLADYLEGRAYYEPEPEEEFINPVQSQDIFKRLGVIRKLTPHTQQDKLKRILIKRGHGDYKSLNELEELYGFRPASVFVHGETPAGPLTLSDFYNHWAPIPEDFVTSEEYLEAYSVWADCDDQGKNCSQWYQAWPYVPMFTREDAVGYIVPFDEPGQTSSDTTTVYHPHLARTYEASSALQQLLSPWILKEKSEDPDLPSKWISPAPWNPDPFWIYSGQNIPPASGPVCDPTDPFVSSSGDLAYDTAITTQVDSLKLADQYIVIDNPQLSPLVEDDCGEHFECEECQCNENTGECKVNKNSPNCFYEVPVRFSATYFKTRTPYLGDIMDRLVTGKTGLFSIFKSASEKAQDPPKNWPGVGLEEEENPNYSFSNGSAEAGLKNPGDQAKFLYKYLGYIHCQKEKLLSKLSPLGLYTPYSYQCFGSPSKPDSNRILELADAQICAIAASYNFDCAILKAIQLIETGTDPYNHLNLGPLEGTPLQYCNPQGYCGPFQVGAGLQVSLGIPLDKFETMAGNAEAAIRQIQMRMCQAEGGCNDSKWTPDLKDKYSLGPEDYDIAAYYHFGTDQPHPDTESRWGDRATYGDAIEQVVKTGVLP